MYNKQNNMYIKYNPEFKTKYIELKRKQTQVSTVVTRGDEI